MSCKNGNMHTCTHARAYVFATESLGCLEGSEGDELRREKGLGSRKKVSKGPGMSKEGVPLVTKRLSNQSAQLRSYFVSRRLPRVTLRVTGVV